MFNNDINNSNVGDDSNNNNEFDTTAILHALSNSNNSNSSSNTSSMSSMSRSNSGLVVGDDSPVLTSSTNSLPPTYSPTFVGIKPKGTLLPSIAQPQQQQQQQYSPQLPSNQTLHTSHDDNSIMSKIMGGSRGGSRNAKYTPPPISLDPSSSTSSSKHAIVDDDEYYDEYEPSASLINHSNEFADEEYDPDTPLNPSDFSRIYNTVPHHTTKRFVYRFPLWMEEKLRRFDDPIIALCQRNTSRAMYYFSLGITAFVAIEIAVMAPFVLFILGQDALATEYTYLALLLALLSQVPKRFLWRFRPYMVHRAKTVKKDMTSSFPSRAVTCSVVYSFAFIWGLLYYTGGPSFQWWMPFLFIVMIALSSFARINLGVHYPSDCAAGVLQGALVCLIGTGLRSLDISGCRSCWDGACYASTPSCVLSFSTLGRLNFVMMAVLIVICIVIPIVSVMKPVDFWSKCDRVYGMLFPSVCFQLLFLCPRSYSTNASLPKPPVPHWYSFIFGISLALLATVFATKVKLKNRLITFWAIFLALTVSLFCWRISMVG
ncbi:hypothetical protein SAMD00019534_050250 [Acytostelium subglobosum LB1]|uniref:hypothetical protein n=1 Tax=Acytostelium subglobosum LB1 TaxID=1410327 RepID=UPI0006451B53|nr:hypothetical protein SAMD00019534_050250 [Acytostelium subglobosum LB1]GAM21850.1 hypothetical protein SAMD00019534_050250 [Acytostelium subglobosum LB1]|eukprot:XP_012754950.1 hypothetical protein SAMD00019534_050250 [Acytostelium subglobosum LB1]